jgi:CPA2 family monovalent cation:H+ antiporter-2
VAVIIFIKFVTISGIVRLFGYRGGISVMAGAGLLQIGEFSFILAEVGIDTGIFSNQDYSLIIASAIITMLLTPLSMGLVSRLRGRLAYRPSAVAPASQDEAPLPATESDGAVQPVVIAGFGRVGQNVAQGLQDVGLAYSVIEIDPELIFNMRCDGVSCIYGDASNSHVLARADLAKARIMVVTYPDPLAVVTTVKNALTINPKLKIVARVHRVKEAELLKKLGVEELISPEYEASLEFIRRTLSAVGWKKTDVKQALSTIQQDEDVAEFSQEPEA